MSQLSRTALTTLTCAFLCLISAAIARADTVSVSSSLQGGTTRLPPTLLDQNGTTVFSTFGTAQFSSSGTGMSLTPFVGFFQEDGVVNCEQVTMFDRLAEVGAKPYVFAVAAGTLTSITLGLIREDKTPSRGITAGEIITPVPEPATLLLSALSVVVAGVAAKMRRRRRKDTSGE